MAGVTVVARIQAAKGKGDALAVLLSEQCGVIRGSEPGGLAYRLHRATDYPDVFLFYETYADAAAFPLHRQLPHLGAYRKRREDQEPVAGPAQVSVFGTVVE